MRIRSRWMATDWFTLLLVLLIPMVVMGEPAPTAEGQVGGTDGVVEAGPGESGDTGEDDASGSLPAELEGVGIDEKLDAQLPLDLEFVDQTGKKVRLGDYFDGKRPVILTLNYFRCPMLCGLTLNGMVDGLREVEWTAGEEYRILTVSFDPLETPDLANLKRQNYLTSYGRPASADGWDFLTGRMKTGIKPLLETTGFNVKWNERRKEWMHAAALIVCTPEGRISRYLYGVHFAPRTLRLSLVEASEGKIGSTVDRILLYCFHYDAAERKYALAGWRVMQAGAVLTMVAVGGFLTLLWRRDARRGVVAAPAAPSEESGESTTES